MRIVQNDYNGKLAQDFGTGPDGFEAAAKCAADTTYADGELERLRERCDNLAGMLGRLLYEVHNLRPEQVSNVLGYRFEIRKD